MGPETNPLHPIIWAQLWQVSAMALVTALIVRTCCGRRPHLAYLLCGLVLVKSLTPPLWSSPIGLFSWLQSEVQVTPTNMWQDTEASHDQLARRDSADRNRQLWSDSRLAPGPSHAGPTTHGGEAQHAASVAKPLFFLWLAGVSILCCAP